MLRIQNTRKWSGIALALAIGASVAQLTGCVVVPARGGVYPGVVAVEPPPIQEEYIGAPPVAGYVWIGGFWNWSGGRYVWAQGHWEAPRPGYRWVPHTWSREHDGWHAHEGHWEERR